jgi:DAK2 domain fusion protein YloV
MADASIQRFRRVMSVALAHLEERREEINDLNVFPVADGDTGDNMALTMRAVLAELERLEAESEGDPQRPEIVRTVARAAMMGARGNSGVILSQIVRGAAEELTTPPGRLIDPRIIAAALSNAERAAYASIRNPVEGTMLTVAREMAHAVSKKLAHWEQHELPSEASDEQQNALLGAMLGAALEAAGDAVSHTPEQLDVLADAGVVDAGALGLAVIVRGAIAGLAGEEVELPEIPHYAPAPASAVHHGDSRYRYCTNFAVIGSGLERRRFEPKLEALGDSVLVVGDEATLRVHVHTDDPDAAKALFAGVGTIENEDIADMHQQVAERAARLGGRTAAVAVASGKGLQLLFEELGAAIVDGGPTLNPSTNDILTVIEATPTAEVVVFPNSKNVHLAAEEAAKLSSKEAVVVPTVSQQGALAALVELDAEAGAAENAERLAAVLDSIRVGGVAPAARDDVEGRFLVGEAVGFEEDEVVAWGEPEATLAKTLERLVDGAEIVTIIEGESAPLELDDLDLELPTGVEVELHRGGQPNWHWLIATQ